MKETRNLGIAMRVSENIGSGAIKETKRASLSFSTDSAGNCVAAAANADSALISQTALAASKLLEPSSERIEALSRQVRDGSYQTDPNKLSEKIIKHYSDGLPE